ncbi:MAG: TIM barrel protein, partial [Candidatus Eremiobacteraeota bacterium]|nr:TIM barrel protein [Candidatus Eremiobacteraeota bacterium]
EYLAQLKKCAVDLGLTVAAVASGEVLTELGARWLDVAVNLGAPLVITSAPAASSEAAAWGQFTETLKARARDAKSANVTLALRGATETQCVTAHDLARATKDVDSAWLRYAFDTSAPAIGELANRMLSKAVVALHTIEDVERFASDDDPEAGSLVQALARFRGFVVLDAPLRSSSPRDAYHAALERFATLRATCLASATLAPSSAKK